MPTHIVPIANMAGSAGKTTTAVSLAVLLAQAGRRVLLVDLDSQCNATEWLGCDPDEVEASSAAVLLKKASLVEALVKTTVDGLLLLPASTGMEAEVMQLQTTRGSELRLKVALRDCPEDVDVVLIDCPGQMGVMTVAALVVATSVVTVTAPGSKELSGVPKIEALVEDLADDGSNEGLTLGAVVPCIVPSKSAGKAHQTLLGYLKDGYGDRVTPEVRRSIRVTEAQQHQIPLPLYAAKDPVTDDYRAVLAHLQAGGIL
jgi:chromosome partitioning protein